MRQRAPWHVLFEVTVFVCSDSDVFSSGTCTNSPRLLRFFAQLFRGTPAARRVDPCATRARGPRAREDAQLGSSLRDAFGVGFGGRRLGRRLS